ncbi:hypothetical protein [Dermacoccus sp. Tok2021]|uniref:hypothetical protein n=1 Tax=Dermacoccus sp. Tok2021 TaxID=2826873 RepID=UPI001CA6B07F|nr:hypothetical protein [Dermacoccus sp. Tok2021]MBZ4497939.1 hypothetical protein [Dermacoccus sp. Tok2021]
MTKRTFDTATSPDQYGQWGTINGQPITDDTITGLVADAEAGFPDATLNPVGRPRTVGTKRAEPSPPPSTRYAVAPSMSTWPADG